MDIKTAVIGFGDWGQNLARNLFELNALDAICDIDADKLRQAKNAFPGLKTTKSHTQLLKSKNIDAVVISAPAQTHYQLTKEFLLAGKDVFVEKPIALSLDKAVELIALSEQKKRILMVGHLLEYHPAILRLKEMIDSGALGEIYYIYSNRLNIGKVRKEENILWSFAPHDISVILLLLGQLPVSVSTHGGNYLHKNIADVTVSNLKFNNGTRAHIFVSWLHPYKEQKLIVVGAQKMAVFNDNAEKDKLRIYNHKVGLTAKMPTALSETVQFNPGEPLKEECKHFLHCVKTKQRPKTDGYNGLGVLQVLQACQYSLERNGQEIRLNTRKAPATDIYIHPTATVENGSNIGKGTKIWHYSHIAAGAKIGKNCRIGQNVFVDSEVEIGVGVKIQNNVSIYNGVKLEDSVFCGPSVVFTNVTNPRSHISRKNEFKQTLVKKGATIGANATIICGVTIEKYAFIGAGAVVTKDIPAYALVYGNPAQIKGWVCKCGLRLKLKGQKGSCKSCGKVIFLTEKMRK